MVKTRKGDSPNLDPSIIRPFEIGFPRPARTEFYPDSHLTYVRDGQRWTFNNGRIYVEGYDVASIIGDEALGVAYWVGLAEGLTEYRRKIGTSAREVIGFAKFSALVDALLERILGQMKKNYNEKIFGLKWRLQDGQFILNGINIRSFLALYRLRKTEKARKFLKGLRGKLASIQGGGRGHGDYEKVQDLVDDLIKEIDETVDESPPPSTKSLPGRRDSNS